MRITQEQIEHALKTLGVFKAFVRMNRSAQSFDHLSGLFEDFKSTVKKTYLEKAKMLHPDKQQGDAEKMKTLNAAYDLFKELRLVRPQPQPQIRIVHIASNYYGGPITSTTSTTSWPSTGGF